MANGQRCVMELKGTLFIPDNKKEINNYMIEVLNSEKGIDEYGEHLFSVDIGCKIEKLEDNSYKITETTGETYGTIRYNITNSMIVEIMTGDNAVDTGFSIYVGETNAFPIESNYKSRMFAILDDTVNPDNQLIKILPGKSVIIKRAWELKL